MIGQIIKDLRRSKKLSQTEFAKIVGVSQTTVTAWETGKAEPSSSAITRIADYFDVSTDYLLGRPEKKLSSEEQETKDLKKFLENNLDNGMTFGDGKVTQEDREKLEIALTQIFYRYHDEFKKRKEEKGGFKF
ncbi:helix-turn-helix domain-containing protein [Ligilactobacillus animalis]|uniref:helix-turn-helix domain-containing protein n=1 Tax=Ligilactobacillus animalis TaxID=1605 RepID=UPI0026E077A2|nr:helix-turn-helix domain-containing protein [Ligilactobacillus animalis]MDO5883894.1 helix-turn-helix domain-containing protein [Ligilactobacillus animalis]MDU1488398.1 helix-turn-helix domain-containing protein [Ligilactobacillus animalis]